MPGDSFRQLDYKVLAKTGRYYIKQYQEETNLKAYILVDHSGSMGYGSHGRTKLEYAKALSAAMSLLLLKQRDAVGLVPFSDAITELLPPRSAMGWLQPLIATLENLTPTGETNVASALLDIAERVKRRGLVVLVSDLLEDPEEILSSMKAIRHLGHELLVFHILDPLERSFAFQRDARFKDLETEEIQPSRPWHIKNDYSQAVESFIDDYKTRCRHERIDYRLFTTDTPYEVALFEFLSRRKRII